MIILIKLLIYIIDWLGLSSNNKRVDFLERETEEQAGWLHAEEMSFYNV